MGRSRIATGLIIALLGFPQLSLAFRDHRLEGVHGLEIFCLISAGVCFGLGISTLISRNVKFRGD